MNILPKDGEIFYYPAFISPEESNRYLATLLKKAHWNQEPITIFGKKVMQPRLTAYYGDSDQELNYSGITMHSRKWLSELLEIKERVEAKANTTFNGVLLNQYRNEKDSMGWHRDNEKELGKNPVIASVSFGATRIFKLRHYFDKQLKTSIELTHGSLLIMSGTTQHFWEHGISKTATAAEVRVNLTFRKIS